MHYQLISEQSTSLETCAAVTVSTIVICCNGRIPDTRSNRINFIERRISRDPWFPPLRGSKPRGTQVLLTDVT